MKIHSVSQGSTEWHALRCSIPTASEFDELLTAKLAIKDSIARNDYLLTKLAGKVMGFPEESVNTFQMGQGTVLEGEALPWLEGVYDLKIQRVGFCTTDDGRVGCSPDGLIGDDDGLEIKCPSGHVHLSHLLGGVVPREYVFQVQGCMLVTDRPKWTFVSYNRYFPALVVHVTRDPAIQGALRAALDKFTADFDEGYAKLQRLLTPSGRE